MREQRLLLLARLRVASRRDALAGTCGDEARGHELAQQGGRRCNDDIAAGSAVENVLPAVADQHVIARPAGQSVVAEAADEDVVAVPPFAVNSMPDSPDAVMTSLPSRALITRRSVASKLEIVTVSGRPDTVMM